MEPSSQEPRKDPEQVATPAQEQDSPAQAVIVKKSKKPLIITLVALAVLLVAGCAGWFWWSTQQKPANNVSNDLDSTKLPPGKMVLGPNTVVYGYNASSSGPRDLFWRPANGGDKHATTTKAIVGSSLIHGNQVLVDTYGDKSGPTVLYSKDGGNTYTTIFTGQAPAGSTDFGDQITGMQFASDGKSAVVAVLPNNGKNTVKQIFFDKPNEPTDLMTSDARGVFPIAYNTRSQALIFSEGCFNCDGNGASTSAIAYYVGSKARTTLIDGADKHLSIVANKAATKLVVTAPTIDKSKTGGGADDSFFWGYYVGAPYTVSVFDIGPNRMSDVTTTVGSGSGDPYVRAGFMADDTTPYYYKDKQVFSFGKGTSGLLYEASQPIYEVHYVSQDAVFASVGTYENFTLNRFNIKSQKTVQILTGDANTTRVFGVTEQ